MFVAESLVEGSLRDIDQQVEGFPHWTPSIGAGLVAGRLHVPFVSSCLRDEAGTVGVQVHAGGQANSAVDLRARFTVTSEIGFLDCLLIPRLEPDGVHRLRTYDDRSSDG